MEVGNMRLCVLSTDSVFLIFLIFENKIQCWKNHILSLVDFQKKFIYY